MDLHSFHPDLNISQSRKMTVLKKHFDPQGYENNLPPQYPYIDETPTDPPSGNYFTYRPTSEEGFSRPMSGQCKFFSQNAKMLTVANNCLILTHSLLITIVLAIALNLLLHSINCAPPQITARLVWGRASTATKASRTPPPTSRARGTRGNQQALRGC